MKRITLLSLFLTLAAINGYAQIGERISISLQGGHQYDLYMPTQDANLDGVPIQDMRGLLSSQDKFDYNFGIDVGVALSPILSLYGNYHYGNLSGSNEIGEYYQSNLMQYGLGLRFLLHNLTRRENSLKKWTIVPFLGLGLTDYNAKRYLLNDRSLINEVTGSQKIYVQGGLELSYHFNRNWAIVLGSGYNWVNDDGLDGFDYGTGSDQFLRTNLGLRYKFTGRRKAIQYVGGRKTEVPVYNYIDRAVGQSANQQVLQLSMEQSALSKKMDSIKSDLSDDVLTRLAILEERTLARKNTIDSLKARDRNNFISAHHAFVYFPIESYTVNTQGKKSIFKFLKEVESSKYWDTESIIFEVLGYTDPSGSVKFNKELRRKRSEAVASLLKSYLGKEVSFEIKEKDYDYSQDAFIDRRVELGIRFKD